MTKAFEIPSTPCKLAHLNNRVEKHGDDGVPAVDLKFTGIILTKDMLNEFTGDKHCHNLMFEQRKGGAIEPTQQYLGRVRTFEADFVDCTASIVFGANPDEHELEDVKIKNITLEPLVGGNTSMNCTVQHELEDTDICAQFAEYQTREVHLALVFGKKAVEDKRQGKLPLDESKSAEKAKGDGTAEAPAVH
jgi:hypothetical protein